MSIIKNVTMLTLQTYFLIIISSRFSSDYENIISLQINVETIQKQQVELQNAILLGDEAQDHTALREEDKAKIRTQMNNLKSQWQNLEDRMQKKIERCSLFSFCFLWVFFAFSQKFFSNVYTWLRKLVCNANAIQGVLQ